MKNRVLWGFLINAYNNHPTYSVFLWWGRVISWVKVSNLPGSTWMESPAEKNVSVIEYSWCFFPGNPGRWEKNSSYKLTQPPTSNIHPTQHPPGYCWVLKKHTQRKPTVDSWPWPWQPFKKVLLLWCVSFKMARNWMQVARGMMDAGNGMFKV